MKGARAWILVGLGLALAGFSQRKLDRLHAPRRPWVDPAPLGPAAQALQGPLAAGRAFLIPLSFLEVQAHLGQGRLEPARQAALRLLSVAPWLSDVWLNIGWSLAFQAEGPGEQGTQRAQRVAAAEAWLALAARVLPRSPDPPATAAFILAERLPPGSPGESAWIAMKGESPTIAADSWLAEALRRAPEQSPLLARRSGIAVRLAAQALARGDRLACLALLDRALDLEGDLAHRGSLGARTWVRELAELRKQAESPLPWPGSMRSALAESSAGRIFLEALGADPE